MLHVNFCIFIRIILIVSQTPVSGWRCTPLLIMVKECSGGVGIPKYGEIKGRRLTLAKRWLYKSEFYGKLLKAPYMVLSKSFGKEFICE